MSEPLPQVAVWHYGEQTFVPHFHCEGEKRVRIDVHDGLDNYGVFAVERPAGQRTYESGDLFVLTGEPLTDWRIDLS